MTNILVVDDEKIIRNYMQKALKKFGSCYIVENGRDAIKYYIDSLNKNNPIKLIILDIALGAQGTMTGIEVLKEIRNIENKNNIDKEKQSIIIMATGNSEVETVKECILQGCNDYIVKPVKSTTIQEKISKFGFNPL